VLPDSIDVARVLRERMGFRPSDDHPVVGPSERTNHRQSLPIVADNQNFKPEGHPRVPFPRGAAASEVPAGRYVCQKVNILAYSYFPFVRGYEAPALLARFVGFAQARDYVEKLLFHCQSERNEVLAPQRMELLRLSVF
jgi:hypothetical protein